MRVYFEKPRTTVGWKGLINDPRLDDSFRINEGLRLARRILLEVNELELPAGTEFLDMITPQYIADLIAWGAIGAHDREPGPPRARFGLSPESGSRTAPTAT
jgi:3-deoxy-7-phosphoheptulonate synthase